MLMFSMLAPSACNLPLHADASDADQSCTVCNLPPLHTHASAGQNWGSIVSDDSGMLLAAITTGYGANYLYTSSDGGATFTPSATAFTVGSLQPLAASRNGTRLAYAKFLGCAIGLSVDAGKTWNSSRVCPAGEGTGSNSPLLTGVASSGDGAQLYVLSLRGPMFASRDGGNTFTLLPGLSSSPPSQQSFGPIAVSDDGVRIAAVIKTWSTANGSAHITWHSGLYASNDSGVTFTLSPGTDISCTTDASSCPSMWTSIAGSKDGARIIAAASGGPLFTSADFGATYEARQPSSSSSSQQWSAVASSANGTRLAAAAVGGLIFTSADGGATWTMRANSTAQQWTSLASSADGGRLAAVAAGGSVFTSVDNGAAWRLGAACPLCQPKKPHAGLLGRR